MNYFKGQSGFSLILVMVVILLLSLGTTMFISRSSDEMVAGASRRNSELATGLAESSANLLLTRFISQDVTTADMNGDGLEDRVEGFADLSTLPLNLPLLYAFYSATGNDTSPIQRVATGESTGTSMAIASQSVPSGTNEMMVNDLFISADVKPYLYTQTSNGLTLSVNTWAAEKAKNKAAVWMEYEVNKKYPKWVDIYVASAARVGNARGYVRKYVGTYTDELGGMISPITESSIHAGGDTALDTCTTC